MKLMWQYTPAIRVFQKQRQKDHEFVEASLGYIAGQGKGGKERKESLPSIQGPDFKVKKKYIKKNFFKMGAGSSHL
jgi:hypothetical protein